MGLGKTIQTISLFALLYERKTSKHSHIVICPATTLTNWMRELQKWCPMLKVIAYYGTKAERDASKRYIMQEHFDVIITTYNTAAQKHDRLFLKKLEFDYVVLDEAQNIKNNRSLRHQYLAKLHSRYRLLLTGTPLQNNLEELWALLQFIMPDIFTADMDLELDDDKEQTDRRVSRMKVIMAPFVLRRLKQHVSQDLPPKELKIIECPMTEFQSNMYRMCVQQSKTWWQKNQLEAAKAAEDTDIDPDEMLEATEEKTNNLKKLSPKPDSTTEEVSNDKETETEEKGDDEKEEKEEEEEKEEKEEGDEEEFAEPLEESDKPKKPVIRGPYASSVSSMNNIFMELRKVCIYYIHLLF